VAYLASNEPQIDYSLAQVWGNGVRRCPKSRLTFCDEAKFMQKRCTIRLQDYSNTDMADPPKVRSIDRLTKDQLQRKRELDRRAQKLTRDRNRAQVHNLELRVLQLEHQNQDLERRLALCKCENGLRAPSFSQTAHKDADWGGRILDTNLVQLIDEEHPGGYYLRRVLQHVLFLLYYLDRTRWTAVLHDFMHAPLQEVPASSYSAYELLANTELLTGSEIWSTLPKHTLPRCALDRVVTELIQARRPYEPLGGNVLEFQKRPFPSIHSLLNPEDVVETENSPVTSSIVTNIIQVMTVPTLPEQIAILYFMGSVIRWLISPTEANYSSMPEWLRPTPTQLSTPHPVWLDLFVWPKVRDSMCGSQKYHDMNAAMSDVCNASLSVNWPYQLSDMLMQINRQGSAIVLTPSFERHIRDVNNWSLGPQFLEV
jgi:hypothetical protein